MDTFVHLPGLALANSKPLVRARLALGMTLGLPVHFSNSSRPINIGRVLFFGLLISPILAFGPPHPQAGASGTGTVGGIGSSQGLDQGLERALEKYGPSPLVRPQRGLVEFLHDPTTGKLTRQIEVSDVPLFTLDGTRVVVKQTQPSGFLNSLLQSGPQDSGVEGGTGPMTAERLAVLGGAVRDLPRSRSGLTYDRASASILQCIALALDMEPLEPGVAAERLRLLKVATEKLSAVERYDAHLEFLTRLLRDHQQGSHQ